MATIVILRMCDAVGSAAKALALKSISSGRRSRTNGIGSDPQLHPCKCSPWGVRSD